MRKDVIRGIGLAVVSIGLYGTAYGASLTAAEIAQIQSALNVTLSSNEITQLSAIVYPTNMPAWRSAAYARIDSHRKADLDIRVVDQNGDPVEGAQVEVKLRSSAFKFGGVCDVQDLTDAAGNFESGFTTSGWKNLVTNLFNAVGLNNAFKPKLTSQHTYIPGFTNWAAANQLAVRGHLLMWPGGGKVADLTGGTPGVDYGDHLSTASTSAYAHYNVLGAVQTYAASPRGASDKAALKTVVDAEITEWASRWNVYEWDVINETIGNTLLQDILGYNQMAEWFKIAESNKVNPACGLLINEFKIISADHTDDGSAYNSRRNTYMNRIDTVITNGGPITGIGFQSRFNYGHIDPATVYSRLNDFATNYPGFNLAGTEFEMTGKNGYTYTEAERAQMTEEILTAYFSHAQVTGLNAWDFMAPSSDPDPDVSPPALCWYDGTVKLNGLVWYYLHRIRYNTDAALASGLDGRTGLRAFKGDYNINVRYKGQNYSSTLVHTNSRELTITLASSVADDANTESVIDAWGYDGLTNGAGLASGISTGLVGGAYTPDSLLASIQNETVRWQSEGVTDSTYRNIAPSSSSGASNGLYQLSVDYLDADFTASSAVTNGSGRVSLGLRSISGGSTNDAAFRLVFSSGNGTNPVYRLEVTDSLGANQVIGTFAGTTLNHLSVRAVYDLNRSGSNGSFKVFYRLNGAVETSAYSSGKFPAGFDIDLIRLMVQTYNGGVNWIAGDRIYTDNLVLRKLSEPPPPPPSPQVIIAQKAGAVLNNVVETVTIGTFTAQTNDVLVFAAGGSNTNHLNIAAVAWVSTNGGAVNANTLFKQTSVGIWYTRVTASGTFDVNFTKTNNYTTVGAYLIRASNGGILQIVTNGVTLPNAATSTNAALTYGFGTASDGVVIECMSTGAGGGAFANYVEEDYVNGPPPKRDVGSGLFTNQVSLNTSWTVDQTGGTGNVYLGGIAVYKDYVMPAVNYTLTVNNGTGGGSYTNGQQVAISASNAPTGKTFDVWTGGTQYLASAASFASNTVIMPANAVTLTATYKDLVYTLTGSVTGGNGTVSPTNTNVVYGSNAVFVITANPYYRIATLKTNNVDVIGMTFNNSSTSYSYTWTNVQATGTVTLSFVAQVTTNAPAQVPYEWLAGYGLTNYDADAIADHDLDGLTSWQEYIAGTVPTNAASVLKAAQTNRNVVTWTAQSNRIYSVYWSTNLMKGFTNKQDNILYPTNSYTNATPDGRVNHYQIKVRMQ